MMGGGAERIITMLSNNMVKRGYEVSFIITHQKKENAYLPEMDPEVNVISLVDETEKFKVSTIPAKWLNYKSRIIGKCEKVFLKGNFQRSKVINYISNNYKNIQWLKYYFKDHSDDVIVAFMYDASFYALLAKSNSNRVIISERGDPQQSINSKTTMAFIKNEFPKADGFVFQSPDVQKWYLENTPVKGTVIFNPIKSDFPAPYSGERKKRIVNFCRISAQKNLGMLVDAFARFHKDFPEYELDVIGDPVGNAAEGYIDSVNERIKYHNCESCIHILPARNDIHDYIKDYAMFVSSSDFEGMSNSMLEAMALGLPCVCTDCPAGGARAVIKDGENGLLTPVGDADALYLAMKRIAEDPELASKLSANSVKIREEQSVDKIIEKWLDVIND